MKDWVWIITRTRVSEPIVEKMFVFNKNEKDEMLNTLVDLEESSGPEDMFEYMKMEIDYSDGDFAGDGWYQVGGKWIRQKQ